MNNFDTDKRTILQRLIAWSEIGKQTAKLKFEFLSMYCFTQEQTCSCLTNPVQTILIIFIPFIL